MKSLMIPLTLIINSLLGAIDPNTMTEEEIFETFQNLDWKTEGTLNLPLSHSSIALPEGYGAILGKDIETLYAINREPLESDVEAVVFNQIDNGYVIFCSVNDGYVTLDDWQEINPKELLQSIIENNKITNEKRKELGGTPIEIVGWAQEPFLDRHTNTVYWAIEVVDSHNIRSINSEGLRLGRNGYESVNWVTSKEDYIPLGGNLDDMLCAHSFNPGFRYTDHIDADRIAGYGIAALVAAMTGGKIAKAGSLVALLAILKKFSTLIITAVAGLAYKFRGFFKRYQS